MDVNSISTEMVIAVTPEDLAKLSPKETEILRNRIKLTIASHPEIKKILQAEAASTLRSLKKKSPRD